jgi:ATP-dependent Clp protease, protease subunit
MNNSNYFVPMVVESSPHGERAMDIRSRMMKDRIIILDTDVNEHSASALVLQLLLLESQGNDDIHLYINSPGGSVIHGNAVYDVMQFIKPDVSTIVMGQAASFGSLLAQAGAPGKRFMLPSARHMAHQVSSGARGTTMDMEISLSETVRLNDALTNVYVKHNSKGKTFEELKLDMSRDRFMTAQESIVYGLADAIITQR